jgi:hypothetical protein
MPIPEHIPVDFLQPAIRDIPEQLAQMPLQHGKYMGKTAGS